MRRTWGVLSRGFGTLVLLVVAVVLMVRFGQLQASPDPATWHLIGGERLASDYAGAVGERIEIYGRVISTRPVVIRGTYGGSELTLTVLEVEKDVIVGQYLHVYGVVQPDYTLRALDTVVYPESGISVTYILSGLAGVWTAGRFLNRWRIDWGEVAFVPRGRPLVSICGDLQRRPWRGE